MAYTFPFVLVNRSGCMQFSSHIVSASCPYRTDWLCRTHVSRHHRETNCFESVLCMSLLAVLNLQINSHFYIEQCYLLPRSSWLVTLNRRSLSHPTLCNVRGGCGVINLKNDQSINRSRYTSTNRTIGPTIQLQKYRMIQPPTSQTQQPTIPTAEPNTKQGYHSDSIFWLVFRSLGWDADCSDPRLSWYFSFRHK